jgi:hypothetical protein
MDKYKEITNYWNYDASYTLTSLLVLDLTMRGHQTWVGIATKIVSMENKDTCLALLSSGP